MRVGDKIKLEDERQRYTVMACDDRYVVLTKPFNARKTYLYSLVDLERGVCGRCNRIFGIPHDASTPEGAAAVLAELQAGTLEVSRRHFQPLSPRELATLKGDTDVEAATLGL